MKDFNRAIIITALAILLAGFVVPASYFLNPVRSAVQKVSSPIERFMSGLSLGTRRSFINLFSLRSIYEDNAELEKENAILITENVQLSELKRENTLLREQLDFKDANTDYDLLPAQVIAKNPDSFLQSLTINVGSSRGLKIGQAVIVNNHLVGKVDRVYSDHARVSLLTNRTSIANAQILPSRANGLVKGELGYGLVIDSVPQDASIKLNDRVISSGLGGNMPKGLLMGTISEIVSDESDVFQKASVTSSIDFGGLELVFVIIGF